MGILSELDSLLEKIPLWKKLKSVPDEVETLKQRIAALEAKINSKPGDKCPKCGEMTYSLDRTEPDPMFGDMGLTEIATNALHVGTKHLNSGKLNALGR